MSVNNWYNTENWYAAERAAEEQRRETPKPVKTKTKKTRRWPWIIGLCVLAVLIVGSSLLFADRSGRDGHSGGAVAGADDWMPGDVNDFFAEFFADTETDFVESDMPRAELRPDFELQFQPAGEELSLTEIFEQCSPSIVAVITKTASGSSYWGSGIILSADGLILINCHQIEGCVSAEVTLWDDSTYEATLVGGDPITDLAVLYIEAEGLPVAEFGDSGLLKVGEQVSAIGNPLSENFRGTMTNGIISALDRGVPYKGHTLSVLQTNTAINNGSSGGALLNRYGQVVGVTNMKMYSYYNDVDGMSLAIPSATVKRVINDIVRHGSVKGRTAIGITVGAVPYEATAQYGVPEGLYVSGVSDGSDAKAKGIQVGDVITEIDGVHVWDTDQVNDIKDGMTVGDTLSLTIWREGVTMVVDIKLMDYYELFG